MMTSNKKTQLFGAVALAAAAGVTTSAQAATIANASPNVTYDFETFTGSGFAPAPTVGQLDSDDIIATGFSDAPGDLAFGGTATSGDFARGVDANGDVTTGGVYAFTTAAGADTLLGVQPGGSDFTPGTFVFKFTNTGTTAINSVAVASTLYVNNNEARGNSFDTYYSTDATVDTSDTLIDAFTSGEAAAAAALDFVLQPGEATGTVTGLSIAPGSDFFIGYFSDDVNGSGSRDEFGLGSVSVTATFAPDAGIPEPASLALLGLGGLMLIARRRRA